MHKSAHRSRYANASWWTFRLEPRCHIHRVSVEVGAFRNGIADVDPYPKADCSIRRLVCIDFRNLVLHLDGKLHRPFNAVERHQKGIASSVDEHAAVLLDGRINQIPPESLKPS